MSNILDKLEAKKTGYVVPYTFKQEDLAVTECERVKEFDDFRQGDEYHLTTQLRVSFIANKAQFSQRLAESRKYMASLIYSDVLDAMGKISYLISNQQNRQAYIAINDLRKKLMGGE